MNANSLSEVVRCTK